MQRPLLGALALVSAPALASFPAVDELAFAPAQGLTLTTTIDQTVSFTLTDQETTVTVAGEEQEQDPATVSMSTSQRDHIVWTDSFESVEDAA